MPGETTLRCFYEVLGVQPKATADEIRAAYKKKSLLYHPDRNYGNQEEAALKFKEVHNAYTVLSDDYERAWYDAHKADILRGGDGTGGGGSGADGEDELNLFKYFTDSCFGDYDDSEDGFFTVYRNLFALLAAAEAESSCSTTATTAPDFGDSTTPWDGVQRFYQHWANFSTVKSFACKDEYKINELEDRYSRRAAERINQKNRQNAKKEYTQTVQNLVHFVRRRDPRVAAATARQAAEAQERQEALARAEHERHKRRLHAKNKIWAEAAEREQLEEAARAARGEALDGSTLDMLYEQERQAKAMMEGKKPTGMYANMTGFAMLSNDDDEKRKGGQVQEALHCAACNKRFTAQSLYKEHMNSRKHKTRVKQLAAKGILPYSTGGEATGEHKEEEENDTSQTGNGASKDDS